MKKPRWLEIGDDSLDGCNAIKYKLNKLYITKFKAIALWKALNEKSWPGRKYVQYTYLVKAQHPNNAKNPSKAQLLENRLKQKTGKTPEWILHLRKIYTYLLNLGKCF